MAAHLKRAYTTFAAPSLHQRKIRAILFVQARYKLKYHKKKQVWANIFRVNFEKAIVEFKAEKRKIFEISAGKTMISVLKAHVFRNKVAKALKAR
jgi:hypothetical protein